MLKKFIFAVNHPCMSDSIVIVPTYNEIDNIEAIIRAVFALEKAFDILVVDDSSPDGTAAKVAELQEAFPGRLFLESRRSKSGLGTAYVHGFKWALRREYGYVFEMDADFSHNPADLVRLYDSCRYGKGDVSIGSRYITGVNVVNWPLSRVLLSYFASVYVRWVTGMVIRDATAGFMCYRSEVLRKINLDRIHFIGYAFQIEMKYRAYCAKCNIIEVPIIFTDRTKGQSKMSNSIIKEAVFGVVALRIRHLFGRF
jgi:dolichol-phosphate mannosyltransferase